MKSFSYYFAVFLCCFGIQQSTYAQSYIDSLVTVLKTGKEDTNRVNTLLSLGSEYKFNGQYDSSLLTLQANSAENEKLTEYLLQSQNRIQSLSVLHDLL